MPTVYKTPKEVHDFDILADLRRVIDRHERFRPIDEFGLKIDLLIAYNDAGRDAVKHHGAAALAKIKVVGPGEADDATEPDDEAPASYADPSKGGKDIPIGQAACNRCHRLRPLAVAVCPGCAAVGHGTNPDEPEPAKGDRARAASRGRKRKAGEAPAAQARAS